MSEQERQPEADAAVAIAGAGGPVGIGGWLVLPMFGLVATPILTGIAFYTEIAKSADDYAALGRVLAASRSDPAVLWRFGEALGGQGLALLASGLGLSLLGLFLGVVAPIILLVLMFRRFRLLPPLMIAFYLTNLAVVVLLFAFDGIGGLPADPHAARDMSRTVVTCLIWIPYFLVSKRVKNTFVN